MLPLSMILAVSANRVIGRAGTLPWKFSEDLKYFRRMTTSANPEVERAIIMGRKTHQSIGKALPKRHNIVITRTPIQPTGNLISSDCSVASSLTEAIESARVIDSEPIVIGGASLYMEALPLATKIYLTTVHADYEGDVFVPEEFPAVRLVDDNVLAAPPGWRITAANKTYEEDTMSGRKAELSWTTLVRA